jgi:hypothetical protein
MLTLQICGKRVRVLEDTLVHMLSFLKYESYYVCQAFIDNSLNVSNDDSECSMNYNTAISIRNNSYISYDLNASKMFLDASYLNRSINEGIRYKNTSLCFDRESFDKLIQLDAPHVQFVCNVHTLSLTKVFVPSEVCLNTVQNLILNDCCVFDIQSIYKIYKIHFNKCRVYKVDDADKYDDIINNHMTTEMSELDTYVGDWFEEEQRVYAEYDDWVEEEPFNEWYADYCIENKLNDDPGYYSSDE